jgi:hypothetical protein
MRPIYLLICFTSLTASVFAQLSPGVSPYPHNKFVLEPELSWGIESYFTHSFPRVAGAKSIDIHSYLATAQKGGKVKSFVTPEFGTEVVKQWGEGEASGYYTPVKVEYFIERGVKDTANQMIFHQIFYIEEAKLKSHIISAAPQYKVFTSGGLFIGNTAVAYSSLNYKPGNIGKKRDDIYFLGQTYSVLNVDSLEAASGLKKTYSRSMAVDLWHGLAQGINTVRDLKTSQIIPPQNVMSYTPFDSVNSNFIVDSIPTPVILVPGAPAHTAFAEVEVVQDWYYNKRRDIFYSRIPKVYLYIKNPNDTNAGKEKRFEVSFR